MAEAGESETETELELELVSWWWMELLGKSRSYMPGFCRLKGVLRLFWAPTLFDDMYLYLYFSNLKKHTLWNIYHCVISYI